MGSNICGMMKLVSDTNRPIQKVGSPEIRQMPELFASLVQNKERRSGTLGLKWQG